MEQTRKNLIILSVFYIISRLLFLTRYPIFNDEAIYLREAWVVTHIPGHIWYSLSDTGKQPLFIWLYGLMWQVIGDPLLAGRLVSVVVGVTTVWAVYLLGGWTAAILVLTAPIFVFFDRLALVDSALSAVFAWILVLLVRLGKHNAVRTAVLAGILVGISFWIKSTGFLLALITVTEFVYILYSHKISRFPVRELLMFAGISAIIGLPLFLRPEAERIFGTAYLYTYSLSELIALNFGNVAGNLLHAFLDYTAYVSPLVVVAFLLSFFSVSTQKKRVLISAWLLAISVVVIFGKSTHARYVLFTVIPVLVLSSLVLSVHRTMLGITVALMTVLSAVLIVDPPAFFHLFQVPQLQSESFGYVDGWPSGYGVKEALAAVDADRRGQRAIIAVRWDSGNPEDSVFVYSTENTGITVKYFDPRLPEDARTVLYASVNERVYFITRQGQYNGFERYLRPLGQFLKPGGKDKVELFRVHI